MYIYKQIPIITGISQSMKEITNLNQLQLYNTIGAYNGDGYMRSLLWELQWRHKWALDILRLGEAGAGPSVGPDPVLKQEGNRRYQILPPVRGAMAQKITYSTEQVSNHLMTELRTLRAAYSIQSTSSMHHYECAALYEDISLQRGRFCTRSLASCIPRSSEDGSSRMFFIQVVRGCPGGRLQFSGGGSESATYQDKNFYHMLGPLVLWGPWTLSTLVNRS